MTSHRLMSVESVAKVEEADETDEYSLGGCTFPTTQRTESFKEISISNEIIRANKQSSSRMY